MRGAAQRVGGRLRIMKTNVVACAIEVLDVIVVVGDAHSMRNERRWRAVGDGGGHGERGHRSPNHASWPNERGRRRVWCGPSYFYSC